VKMRTGSISHGIACTFFFILVGCSLPSLKGRDGRSSSAGQYDLSRSPNEEAEFERHTDSSRGAPHEQPIEISLHQAEKFPSTHDDLRVDPQIKRSYLLRSRATRDDFIDSSSEEGSLWASNGQTNYFFTKNKVRTPGDLITLMIENDLYKEIGLEIKKSLNPIEQSHEVFILSSAFRQKSLQDLYARNPNLVTQDDSKQGNQNKASIDRGTSASTSLGALQESKNESNAPLGDLRRDLFFNVQREIQEGIKNTQTLEDVNRLTHQLSIRNVNIFPTLELQPGDSMAGQIMERYPNGNYKIRTIKRVFYKNGKSRFVKIVGTIKGSDVSEDTDLINSGKLYEYRVEVAQ